MIPQILTDWTIDVITNLLAMKVFEEETFDFKRMLPDSRNEPAKKRLRTACCAFANSDGGFLIFGVSDDSEFNPEDRLSGIEPGVDLPERFGNHPRSCTPTVYWTFKNPPLSLDNGRVIHVVHIPKSWKAPHAVGDRDGGWMFPKRTNKGNEGMSMEEVRAAFLGFYEKRLKLGLLRAELVTLERLASEAYVADPQLQRKLYPMVTFDTGVIESTLSDTYTIIADKSDLLESLSLLREWARIANTKVSSYYPSCLVRTVNVEEITAEHIQFLEPLCEDIQAHCRIAVSVLDKILS